MKTLLLGIKIFFARITDVTMGTFRMLFIVRNKTILATIIAFIEVIIWFLAAKYSFTANSSIVIAIFYAFGYAIGTLIGTHFSHKFDNSNYSIFAIIEKITNKDLNNLKKKEYIPQIISLDNKKKLLLFETCNKRREELFNILRKIDKNVIITQNENKIVDLNNFIK